MDRRTLVYLLVVTVCSGAGSAWAYTEGFQNSFFGQGAGASISAGTGETFIGYAAGNHTNSGNFNTFVGYGSGYFNTAGRSNSFFGYSTGYGATGDENAFFGYYAGYNTTGDFNTFLGSFSGQNSTAGSHNTFIGYGAGNNNGTGVNNTFLGSLAGMYNNGSGNVFVGNRVGWSETGSNRLYIDNSDTPTPLIYGEFDNNKLTVNGNLEVIGPDQGLVRLSNVTTNNTTKAARMVLRHYSNAQLPVYLLGAASTSTNNFVAFGGGNPIGNAATQLDLFTAPDTTTPTGFPRLTIIGNGNVGIGIQDPDYPLEMASGARVTTGGAWMDASSREYKEEIESLTQNEAMDTLMGLQPVKFAYKADPSERHVGFIAEDVPVLVATKDRKGMSSMDVVAVLTKVVQEQQKVIEKHQNISEKQQKTIADLSTELKELKRDLKLRSTTASGDFSKEPNYPKKKPPVPEVEVDK